MNIIKSITRTPERISTKIISEDQDFWTIGCEGCGEPRKQHKHSYEPIDPNARNLEFIEVTKTAPEARRCMTCGPFPKN